MNGTEKQALFVQINVPELSHVERPSYTSAELDRLWSRIFTAANRMLGRQLQIDPSAAMKTQFKNPLP